MDPLLQFLLALAIIIVAAKGGGYLTNRLGQPAVLGELLIGLILGPTVLDMLHWPLFSDQHLGETLNHLSHLGVLFLMFIAGLEVDLMEMLSTGRPAVLAGILGVVAPLALGMAAALPFGFDVQRSLFMGLVLAATSVSISAQCLMELGVLRNRECVALLGGAVVDDVLVILFLSLFVALAGGGGGGAITILWVVVKMVAFLALAVLAGARFLPRLVSLVSGLPVSESVMALVIVVTLLYAWAAEALGGMAAITGAFLAGARFLPWLVSLVSRLPVSESVMALVIVVTLLYAWAAEVLGGMAAITGAFLAGLLFARTSVRQHVETGMHTLAYAWLVPVFFVSVGLEANARALGRQDLPFALLIIVVAVISKMLGSGIGARIGGFSNIESLRLGVGMTSRGEVGLIVASVGLNAGLIGERIFASVVLMVLATTVLTPVMLRALYPKTAYRLEPNEASGS